MIEVKQQLDIDYVRQNLIDWPVAEFIVVYVNKNVDDVEKYLIKDKFHRYILRKLIYYRNVDKIRSKLLGNKALSTLKRQIDEDVKCQISEIKDRQKYSNYLNFKTGPFNLKGQLVFLENDLYMREGSMTIIDEIVYENVNVGLNPRLMKLGVMI